MPTPVDMDAIALSPVLGGTLALHDAQRREWDVVIAGAGPAGSMAALSLARRGLAVLLVDKASFPRSKVCGCCLNAAALAQLQAAGLHGLTRRLGAQPLHELRLHAAGRRTAFPLTGGCSLSREALDAALVAESVAAGAEFLPATRATCGRVVAAGRCVELAQQQRRMAVAARVVLAADGLAGRFLEERSSFRRVVAGSSRIGAGVRITPAPDACKAGVIYMACGPGGYVGLVRLENGQLDVAAAFDPGFVRSAGDPGLAVGVLLNSAGLPPICGVAGRHWHGTPWLSCRRARLAGQRLFVIGDSAAYVEPFTGEGIAWALASGAAVADMATEGAAKWRPSLARCWEQAHRRLFSRPHQRCHVLTRLLRREKLARTVIGMLERMPGLAGPLVRVMQPDLAGTGS